MGRRCFHPGRLLVALFATLALTALSAAHSATALPQIETTGSGLEAGGRPFISFGYFYGGDYGRPMNTLTYFRDPTEKRFRKLLASIDEAKRFYGANTIRLFLQLPDFVPRENLRLDRGALTALRRILHASERRGVYLVLTGNVTVEPGRARPWYEAQSDPERWRTQAVFWQRLASRLHGEHGVAWYELTNEPAVPNAPVTSWYTGELGGFTWAQFVVRETGSATPYEISAAWTRKLAAAVRRGDPQALVSAGLLPFAGATTAFGPASVRDHLDLFAIHTYPKAGAIDEMLGRVERWAEQTGKPVVLGEVAPLAATPRETAIFMRQAEPYVDGYIGHYHGLSPLDPQPDTGEAAWWRGELAMFRRLRPELCGGLCGHR